MKYYFVSYRHSVGYGNIYLSIDSAFFITNEVQAYIKSIKDCDVKEVLILNYKEITKEECEVNSKENA